MNRNPGETKVFSAKDLKEVPLGMNGQEIYAQMPYYAEECSVSRNTTLTEKIDEISSLAHNLKRQLEETEKKYLALDRSRQLTLLAVNRLELKKKSAKSNRCLKKQISAWPILEKGYR